MCNDAIIPVAAASRLDVIELRAVCTDAADYANQGVQPSREPRAMLASQGGRSDAPRVIAQLF